MGSYVFSRSCSLLSKYLPISLKHRKEQSHAQCHAKHRIRIFDKISEHVTIPKFQNGQILLSQRMPLHTLRTLCMTSLLKTSPHNLYNRLGVQTGDFASELWHNHLLLFGAILRFCFLRSIEPALFTGCCYWSKPWGQKTSTQNTSSHKS